MDATTAIKQGYKMTKIGWIPDNWWDGKIQNLVDSKVIDKPMDGNHGNIHPASTDFVSTGIPFVMANSIKEDRLDLSNCNFITKKQADSLQKGFSKTNDVLLTHKGTIGATAIVGNIEYPYIMLTPQVTYYRVLAKNHLSNIYLKLFFQSSGFQTILTKLSGGGTRAYIGISAQRNLPIALPPLPEQQKIAQILSTWDKAIEHSQKLIEQLKRRKKGLMQQLLTGKTRLKGFSGEWKKYQLADLATNYNKFNKDNKVKEVLSCTKYDGLVRSLEYFGRKVFGDDLSKYKVVPSGYFAYATNHIEEGSIGYQDKVDFGLVSPMYTVFKTNDKVADSFFYKLLKTDKLIYYYQSNMSGSIARRGGLRWNVFETIVVKIPSIEEQKAIAKVLTTADKEIKAQETYLSQLQAQKKGLMQQLLTGQKRVNLNN